MPQASAATAGLDGLSLFAAIVPRPGRHCSEGKAGLDRDVWQAIDGFRSVQRFCPSKALERSHGGFRATARRKTAPSGKPIPCGGSTCGREKPAPLGNLSKKDRWKGEESPRVGPYFRTRETTPWRTNARPPQRTSKRCFAGHHRFPEGVAERRDTDVSGATEFN